MIAVTVLARNSTTATLTHLELLPADGGRAPPGAAAGPTEEEVGKAKELVYEASYDDLPFGEPE